MPDTTWSPAMERAEIVLLRHGVHSEQMTIKEGPRDHDAVEAIIRDVRKASAKSRYS